MADPGQMAALGEGEQDVQPEPIPTPNPPPTQTYNLQDLALLFSSWTVLKAVREQGPFLSRGTAFSRGQGGFPIVPPCFCTLTPFPELHGLTALAPKSLP